MVMIGSILMNYLWGLLVDKYRKSRGIKILLGIAVGSNLLILFIFKYLNFTVETFGKVFGTRIQITEILLPIGVSFFTFQAISYVVDIYREQGEVQKNPLNVGLYISFFPQLVAGPIVRYDTIAKQLAERQETVSDFEMGINRFLTGFCKKVLLANTFANIADIAFNDAWKGYALGADFAWVAAIAYSFQILFDFSGYSDMAIGLGKMFGFHFLENFNYPYAAESITDFWRRWHISLGSWFRDYVYIPLGGSRVKNCRLWINLFVVWLLTGIWHGANWTFILWGIFYFVLLSLEKVFDFHKKLKGFWMKTGYRIVTLLAVVFGWIIFRCETLGTILRYVKSMLGIGAYGLHDSRVIFYIKEYWAFWLVAVILCIPIPKKFSVMLDNNQRCSSILGLSGRIVRLGLFLISISYLILNDYNPFIYFNF